MLFILISHTPMEDSCVNLILKFEGDSYHRIHVNGSVEMTI